MDQFDNSVGRVSARWPDSVLEDRLRDIGKRLPEVPRAEAPRESSALGAIVEAVREQCGGPGGGSSTQREPLAYGERHGSSRLDHVRYQSRAIAEAIGKDLKSAMETLGAGSGGRNPPPLVESTDETQPQQKRGQQGEAAAAAAAEEEQERAKKEEEEEGGGKQPGVQEEGEQEEREYTPMLAAWALRGLRLRPLLSGGWSSTASGREAAAAMECEDSAPAIDPRAAEATAKGGGGGGWAADWGAGLPQEVLGAALALVPQEQLPSARLVCRFWSSAASACVLLLQPSDHRTHSNSSGSITSSSGSSSSLLLSRVPDLFPGAQHLDLASRCPAPMAKASESLAQLLGHRRLRGRLRSLSLPPRSGLDSRLFSLVSVAAAAAGEGAVVVVARDCCWTEPEVPQRMPGEDRQGRGAEEGRGNEEHREKAVPTEAIPALQVDLGGCTGLEGHGSQELLRSLAAALPGVTSLSLEGCVSLRPEALAALSGLSRLSRLRLGGCNTLDSLDPWEGNMGEKALRTLAGALAPHGALTYLDLTGLRRLQDGALEALRPLSGSLATLRLEGCLWLAGGGSRPLGALEGLGKLSRLSVAGCAQLLANHLRPLAAASSLTALNLSRCRRLSDLSSLASCVLLEVLDAGDCPGLQGSGGLPELTILPLRHLRLAGCDGLTDIGFGALGRMTDLRLLDLKSCLQLSDMGAGELRHLASLTDLDLSGCPLITNGALSALCECTSLLRLRLARCPNLTDMGLSPLAAALRRLRDLDLSGLHRLQGSALVPLAARRGPPLRDLKMPGCVALRDSALSCLQAIMPGSSLQGPPSPSRLGTTLASLSLSGAISVTDAGLCALTSLQRLEALDLSGCTEVTGSWLVAPGGNPLSTSLRRLCLASCYSYSDGGLMAAGSLRNLRSLDLSSCGRLSDAAIAATVSRLTGLVALELRGSSWVSSKAADAMSRLPRLRSLDLSSCVTVGDAQVASLARIASVGGCLVSLSLHSCHQLTARGVAALQPLSNTLQRLALGRSTALEPEAASHLAAFSLLTHLSLEGWQKLDDAGIESWLGFSCSSSHGSCPETAPSCAGPIANLQELSLRDCTLITDAAIEFIADAGPSRLRHLDVSGCSELTDRALDEIGRGMQQLRSLSMSHLRHVTDHGLQVLSRSLRTPTFEELEMAFCFEVTDGGLAALLKFPSLSVVDVAGCFEVSASACNLLEYLHKGLCVTRQWSAERLAAEEARRSARIEWRVLPHGS